MYTLRTHNSFRYMVSRNANKIYKEYKILSVNDGSCGIIFNDLITIYPKDLYVCQEDIDMANHYRKIFDKNLTKDE